MLKIAMFNQKGGVGKTVSSINIASCLALLDNKVLIVDSDAQANATSYVMSNGERPESTLVNLFSEKKLKTKDVIKSCSLRNNKTSIDIDILPISSEIDNFQVDNGKMLAERIKEVESEYDYCIFDCSPQRTPISLNSLCASDYILCPIFPDVDSIQGYSMILDLISQLRASRENSTIELLGMFFNGVSKENSLDSYIIESYKEEFGEAILDTMIRRTTVITQARYFGLPVNLYKPSHNVSHEYMSLTKEILNRIEDKKRKVGR